MAGIKLKNVERFKDRLGKVRLYYRIGKGKRIALRGRPGTQEFNDSYAKAASKYGIKSHDETGTFNALIKAYYKSSSFLRGKEATREVSARIIDKFAAEHGHRKVADMIRADVEKMFSAKASTPAAANTLLKKLRALMKFAIQNDYAMHDPTQHFDRFKEGTHHTWTEGEIKKYELQWPVGSRERLAFDLHLYTGQRRGDVSRMTWEDYQHRTIRVAQQKGDDEAQDEFLVIPAHGNLQRSIARFKQTATTILCTANNRQFSIAGYGNWMADNIEKAGLPDKCVTHGIRKAAARRLAECGCTSHQIASITGHKTLGEVERYTKAVNQGKLAGQAMESLGKSEFSQEIQGQEIPQTFVKSR